MAFTELQMYHQVLWEKEGLEAKTKQERERLEKVIKKEFSGILSLLSSSETGIFSFLFSSGNRKLREEVGKSCKRVLDELEKSN
jgi:hypothetical protein